MNFPALAMELIMGRTLLRKAYEAMSEAQQDSNVSDVESPQALS